MKISREIKNISLKSLSCNFDQLDMISNKAFNLKCLYVKRDNKTFIIKRYQKVKYAFIKFVTLYRNYKNYNKNNIFIINDYFTCKDKSKNILHSDLNICDNYF
jgi:hypothetical protein